MSYDLMVFLPESAPVDRRAFLDWYNVQSEWEEDHSYDDPSITAPRLNALFAEMVTSFPALNGPFAHSELPQDEARLADYCIGRHVIYIGFAWSKAEEAYAELHRLAGKHRVGFFNVSSEAGEVWLPAADASLNLAHAQ